MYISKYFAPVNTIVNEFQYIFEFVETKRYNNCMYILLIEQFIISTDTHIHAYKYVHCVHRYVHM